MERKCVKVLCRYVGIHLDALYPRSKFAGDQGSQSGRRPKQANIPISFERGNVASALIHDIRNASLSLYR